MLRQKTALVRVALAAHPVRSARQLKGTHRVCLLDVTLPLHNCSKVARSSLELRQVKGSR